MEDESELEYVVKGALMMCDQGAAPNKFTPTHNTSNYIEGLLVSTNMDGKPQVNIPSFYICEKTQKPCVPATAPMTWTNVCPDKANGVEMLLTRCTCPCTIGGKIEFYTSGQIPLPQEQEDALKEMQDEAQKELNDAGYGDSVGETGLVEGMVPVWGSGRDLVNDIQTGDGWGIAANTGFFVWDVVSIGVGFVTFGGGTAVMQGGKALMKGGGKAAAKTISKKAFKKLGCKVLTKADHALNKALLRTVLKKKALERLANPKTWCFVGNTLVHTEIGLKEIKDIQIGDVVKSYLPDENKIVYRRVTALFENEALTTLDIETKAGVIRCTPNHPFYLGDGNYRDASQLQVGDKLFTSDDDPVFVESLQLKDETIKIYNFEVEDSHCYFVGKEGVLVHNTCPKKILDDIASQIGDVYNTAKNGGKHSGFLKNYLGKTKEQIEKGISSLQKQIDEHLDKIVNPEKHIPDFLKLDPRQQQALINNKWPADIKRQLEQKKILEGLLNNLK